MGLFSSFPFKSLFNKVQLKAIIIGLDNAGKTTISFQLNNGQFGYSIPQIGFSVQNIEYKKVKIVEWDVGAARVRLLQPNYYNGVNVIICVLDASDRERIEYARSQFWKLINQDQLKDMPILVFANKQDIAVMKIPQIEERLEFSKINRPKMMIGTCALTGQGLQEGLQWLLNTLSNNQAS